MDEDIQIIVQVFEHSQQARHYTSAESDNSLASETISVELMISG
jgi:hypothetical protein